MLLRLRPKGLALFDNFQLVVGKSTVPVGAVVPLVHVTAFLDAAWRAMVLFFVPIAQLAWRFFVFRKWQFCHAGFLALFASLALCAERRRGVGTLVGHGTTVSALQFVLQLGHFGQAVVQVTVRFERRVAGGIGGRGAGAERLALTVQDRDATQPLLVLFFFCKDWIVWANWFLIRWFSHGLVPFGRVVVPGVARVLRGSA